MFERLATNALALILIRLGLDRGPSRVGASIERVLNAALPEGHSLEIVAVDDGSTDSSVEVVEQLTQRYSQIRLVRHPMNRGKGSAIRTALQHALGGLAIIHDADLEYGPEGLHQITAAASGWQGRRGIRFAFSGCGRAPRSLFLARAGQPYADDPLQHGF
jgi:glycosyltransferase involved in cell wall biosynthesis